MVTDPIADMLTRIRNAQLASHDAVVLPASHIKQRIAELLKREGYLLEVERIEQQPQDELRLTLRRTGNKPAIRGLRRMSTPGRRLYVNSDSIPFVMNGYGIAIVSTSKGLMTDQEAREAKLGGELISTIW